ncbi:MAG: glycosyltransferase family 1 protein, partial [Dehalococcoidia bacterium]|nr:glycosyltransferase family 1 protein [Dehalococcoidia bacterium]
MRIGFVLQDPKRAPSGLDSYTRNLWSALQSVTSGHDLVPVTLPGRFAAHAYSRLLWEQCYLPFWARRARIDLLHMPAGSAPVFDGRRCVLTLHDLGDGPASRYRSALGRRCYFGYALPHSARFAAEVITDSEATKRDAVERLGVPAERITVVPLAPASFFCRAPDDAVEAVRRKYGLAASYFLQVGASVPRKNLAGALAGFARFLARHPELQIQFAVTGAGPPSVEALPAETAELLRGGRTRFLGHVPSEDLAALYGGALAVVVPSFYEGCGLPVLEAFA